MKLGTNLISAFRFWDRSDTQDLMSPGDIRRQKSFLIKAASDRVQNAWEKYFGPKGTISQRVEREQTRANAAMRKAIATVNAYYNVWGIYREGFDKFDNDRLAQNPIYAICEKAIMDYLATLDWDVQDRHKDSVKSAVSFLSKPNPQDSFTTIIRQLARDIIRYDAGVWVKTKNVGGDLVELKCYHGPEFWIEVDHDPGTVEGEYGLSYAGNYSHGYVKRYWQHSRPGVFIPFEPDEICYFQMYPRSDSPYGTDFLQNLKWLLEYLLDSTKAAGCTFANGVTPGLAWYHPDFRSQEQVDQRMAEIDLENRGPEGFGGIIHLLGDERVEVITPTLVNMQWLEGQKYVSELIWSMFGFSPTEFTGSDANRATAYIQKNTTKSKMLYPIMRRIEEVINSQILPDLPGYQSDWEFSFEESVDLDDDLKKAQVQEAKARVVASYVQIGIQPETAMKLAGVDKDIPPDLLHEIQSEYEDMQQQPWMMQQNQSGPERGGSDEAPQEGYQGTAVSDAVQGQVEKARSILRKSSRSGSNNRLDVYIHLEAA